MYGIYGCRGYVWLTKVSKVKDLPKLLPKGMVHRVVRISVSETLIWVCNALHVRPVYGVACLFDLQYSLLVTCHCHLASED